jgi:regulator of sigma E protease
MLTIVAFIFGMGLLVAFHEFGHFYVARRCGVKVIRFSIGFGKPILRWQRTPDDTEYVLCWLPLGGYVRMLDEREAAVRPADLPHAFNRQTLGKRAAIVAAGPAANALLAVVLYAAVQWIGVSAVTPVLASPPPGSLAAEAGLRARDHVRAVQVGTGAEQAVDSLESLRWAITTAVALREPLAVYVAANENSVPKRIVLATDRLPPTEDPALLINAVGIGAPYMAPVLGEVLLDGAGARAGLKSGDRVLAVDGVPIADAAQLQAVIRGAFTRDQQASQQWLVTRVDGTYTIVVRPERIQSESGVIGRVGAYIGEAPVTFEQRFGLIDGLVRGASKAWDIAVMSVKTIGQLLIGDASVKQLSGPIAIAGAAGQTASLGIAPYLSFLGLLSVSLAVLNLLPIPVLDGGHLMYYLWEFVSGKAVTDAWAARLQRTGLFALFALMAVAFTNDIARLLG